MHRFFTFIYYTYIHTYRVKRAKFDYHIGCLLPLLTPLLFNIRKLFPTKTTSFDQVYTVPQQFRYGGVLIVLVHVFGRLEELHTLTFALNCGLLTVSDAHIYIYNIYSYQVKLKYLTDVFLNSVL